MQADLESLDPALLTPIVRRALGQRAATAQLDTWRIEPIAGGATGANLYRIAGDAHLPGHIPLAPIPWSLVVKRRAPPRDPARAATDDWRRAPLAYQLGLLPLDAPAPGLVAARCHELMHRPDGSIWMWSEDLGPLAAPWTTEDYVRAARHFGRFNAAPLARGIVPSHPWFFPSFLRYWLDDLMSRWTIATITSEAWNHPLAFVSILGDIIEGPLQQPETWDHPLLRAAYSQPVAARALHLWRERHTLLDALDRLPRTLIHGDAHVMNLFRRPRAGGDFDTVAIDWDTIGLGPLGEDAGRLLAAATFTLRDANVDLPHLYRSVLDAYLAGTAEAYTDATVRPSSVTPEAVRFAITSTAALAVGLSAAAVPAAALSLQLRDTPFRAAVERLTSRTLEDEIPTLARAAYFLLDLADEAFSLLPSLRTT